MKKVIYIIIFSLISIGGVGGIYFYKIFYESNTLFNDEYIFIKIPTNSTENQLLDSIGKHVKDLSKFSKAANYKDYLLNIKPGRYKLENGFNNNQIINSLRSNNVPIKITYNNIETFDQLIKRISERIEADSLSLSNVFYEEKFLNDLGLDSESVFSLFIPNTYEFFWNTSAIQFRERILKEFDRFWNDSRIEKSKKVNLNPIEVMTLASIVQKETPKVDERPTIAGVYLNRLRKNMKLQADPTVVYSIKQKQGFDKVIRRVLYKDLRIKSEFNTYRNKGLPPGPICMPDLDAIDAILNAETHKYLYFVADPENRGYHLFGKNLREHNINKKKYVRWINKKKVYR